MKKLLLLILLINMGFVANIYADDLEVYDSGWVSINQNEYKTFTHNLGGDTNNYEIDIQQKELTSGQLIHNIGQGGGGDAGFLLGTQFQELTNSTIKVFRYPQDGRTDEVRVVIRENRDSNIQDNTNNTSTNISNISTNTSNISNNRNLINNNSQRLDNHEGRIEDLEETQFNVMGEVQFIRKKNHTVSAYAKYDVRHSRVPEVGLKLTVGLGKSWTQEELERLEIKLNRIEKLLKRVAGKRDPIETKMIKTDNGYSIVIDEPNTVKLMKKF